MVVRDQQAYCLFLCARREALLKITYPPLSVSKQPQFIYSPFHKFLARQHSFLSMSSINEKKADLHETEIKSVSEVDYEYGNEGGLIDINRDHAGSSWMAYFNVVCVVAGTGTLGLPVALKQGGWLGVFILFLSWGMSIYTGIILVRCLYANGKTRLHTYKEIATTAYGWIGGWVTFFFNAWIVLGAPVLYMVLAGQNLNQLCKGTAGELGNTPWIIISCAIIAVPFVLVKTLKEVAWMSAFGALATVVVVLICLVMSAIDKPNQVNIQHNAVIWNMFPIALSTISFSFGGNVVYPHVEASMKNPRDWPKVVAGGLSTCAAMYLVTAISGYLIYGTTVKSPIYDSIPAGVPQIIAVVVITIHVLMAAPILLTSFSLDIEEMANISVERFGKVKEFLLRASIRLATMVVVGVISCIVPHFGELMSLIGAFANCALIFIFPVLFYLKLTGFRNKSIFELFWCFLVVLLGLVGLIFGTIEAIKELIAAFH
ncbi:transmembrane amino acid transporter protein-domain-containing protein [Mycotypha africana]|uniref:transmembrane amino acid transporter protein-domain-containing protein n=1 Tax=Mycotypha africana TaxID=64632 RepID=UPI0023019458|nr:transmembrane amino acid transporter protein-domain-containing protein [Mycotypha africana]KAI8991521.1 transmembrane amino acid transporter protein-domain-containing protein [Mycotypha africana]